MMYEAWEHTGASWGEKEEGQTQPVREEERSGERSGGSLVIRTHMMRHEYRIVGSTEWGSKTGRGAGVSR